MYSSGFKLELLSWNPNLILLNQNFNGATQMADLFSRLQEGSETCF